MSWQDNNGNTVLHACATCEHRQKRWECARVLLAEKRLPLQVLNGKHQTAADICSDVDLRDAMRHAMEVRCQAIHCQMSGACRAMLGVRQHHCS